MGIRIADRIREKLRIKHGVFEEEVHEAFANRSGRLLVEKRAKHLSNEPKYWFISETDKGRKLKIVFVAADDGELDLATAYEPNAVEERLYEKNK